MTTTLLIDNLCAYSLQVLAIVATAAIFLTLARSLTPRARLAVWGKWCWRCACCCP